MIFTVKENVVDLQKEYPIYANTDKPFRDVPKRLRVCYVKIR